MIPRITIARIFSTAVAVIPLCWGAVAGSAPLGLPALPSDVQPEDDRAIALGQLLFFDRRLSADGDISCATCHRLTIAFTDSLPIAHGTRGLFGTRNTPSLYNVAYQKELFWDGRVGSLETQARLPLLNPREHGLQSDTAILRRINADPQYRRELKLWLPNRAATMTDIVRAIASYERTLLAGDSPFDRYTYAADSDAMSRAAIRGMQLFQGRAGCGACHPIGIGSALFTDFDYHASPIALPQDASDDLPRVTSMVVELRHRQATDDLHTLLISDPRIAALGRFVVTLNPRDIGRFKTPSLRNVAITAPYFHDGSVATLAEAIDAELYSRGDSTRYPIVLSANEKADLLEFLNALTSPGMRLTP